MRLNPSDVLVSGATVAAILVAYALSGARVVLIGLAILPFAQITATVTVRVVIPVLRRRGDVPQRTSPSPSP